MTTVNGYSGPPPMPLLRWLQRYAALRELLEAYEAQPADDQPDRPSAALNTYLSVVGLLDPAAPALAARQLRVLVDEGRVAAALGAEGQDEAAALALLPWPATGGRDRWEWMAVVAQLLESAVASGLPQARTGAPETPWAWRRSFPHLFQLFAGYFGQDFPEEHPGRSAEEAEREALAEWRAETSLAVQARTAGELHELAALRLDRAELELALGALGRDVQLAIDPGMWLSRLGARLTA